MRSECRHWFTIFVLFASTVVLFLDNVNADKFINSVGRRHRLADRMRREIDRNSLQALPLLSHIDRDGPTSERPNSSSGSIDDNNESGDGNESAAMKAKDSKISVNSTKHAIRRLAGTSETNKNTEISMTAHEWHRPLRRNSDSEENRSNQKSSSDTSQSSSTDGFLLSRVGSFVTNAGSALMGTKSQDSSRDDLKNSDGDSGLTTDGNAKDQSKNQKVASTNDQSSDSFASESSKASHASIASDASDASDASEASKASKASKASDASEASKAEKASSPSETLSGEQNQSKVSDSVISNKDDDTNQKSINGAITSNSSTSKDQKISGEERKSDVSSGSGAENDGKSSQDNENDSGGVRKDSQEQRGSTTGILPISIGIQNNSTTNNPFSTSGSQSHNTSQGSNGSQNSDKSKSGNAGSSNDASDVGSNGGNNTTSGSSNNGEGESTDADANESKQSSSKGSNGTDESGNDGKSTSNSTTSSSSGNDQGDPNTRKQNANKSIEDHSGTNADQISKKLLDPVVGDNNFDGNQDKTNDSSQNGATSSDSRQDGKGTSTNNDKKEGKNASTAGGNTNDGKSDTSTDNQDVSQVDSKSGSQASTGKGSNNTSSSPHFQVGGKNSSLADGGSGNSWDSDSSKLVGGSSESKNDSDVQNSSQKGVQSGGTDQFGSSSDQYDNQDETTSKEQSAGSTGNDDSNGKTKHSTSDPSKSSGKGVTQGNPQGSTNSGNQSGVTIVDQGSGSHNSTIPTSGSSSGSFSNSSTSPPIQTGSDPSKQEGSTTTNTSTSTTSGAGGNTSSSGSGIIDSGSSSPTTGITPDSKANESTGNSTITTGEGGDDTEGAVTPIVSIGMTSGTQNQSPSQQQGTQQTTSKTVMEKDQPKTKENSNQSANDQAFGWANSKQLLLPDVATVQSDGDDNSDNSKVQNSTISSISAATPGEGIATASGSTTQSPLPLTIPNTIVPAGTSVVQPSGTTMIAILLKPVLSWSFLTSSPNTVAQIFLFMPSLLAEAVELQNGTVTTIRLQIHQLTDGRPTKRSETDLSVERSLYLAYVATELVALLQEKISNTTSEFYTIPTNPVAKSLADNVDPSYDITEMSSVGTANKAASRQNEGNGNTILRNALIGVGTALASCILLFFLWRLWKRNQKRYRKEAVQNVLSRGVAQRGTIHSFSCGNPSSLRETWAPSLLEQERVLHGQLAETWEHNDAGHAQPIASSTHEPDMAFIGGLARPASSRGHSDVFADQVTNRSSQETERSTGADPQRNTLLSNLNSFDNRSRVSIASHMTEAQRIQHQYFENQQSNSSHLERERISPVGLLYQSEYERPAQNTLVHAYGSRTNDSRTRRSESRYSRSSLSTSSIGRPEMQCNSMCM